MNLMHTVLQSEARSACKSDNNTESITCSSSSFEALRYQEISASPVIGLQSLLLLLHVFIQKMTRMIQQLLCSSTSFAASAATCIQRETRMIQQHLCSSPSFAASAATCIQV
ncbi:uncharacterized protein LOC143267163 isoform X1 [Peromyscus maniculatus bairdii]|uniref:uncharacterized protein LOC143267163 isoform X1 n=1 Tax=Peromyscus maniculatus bairdii TaxID=230844 RepID=UPI003FD65518